MSGMPYSMQRFGLSNEVHGMKKAPSKENEEQQLARTQRQELKAELAAQHAKRPRKPRNRRRVITLSVLAVIAVLAGIFGVLLLLPSPTPAPIAGIAVGKAVPEFVLPIYGGGGSGMIDLHALRGHPVVINFWSESCVPCKAEVPFLQKTYAQYGAGASGEFALLGINQADPNDTIAGFGRDFKVTYPLLFDPGGTVNAAYGVTDIPTTYFIDGNGIVRAAYPEQLTPQTMRQGLAAMGVLIP